MSRRRQQNVQQQASSRLEAMLETAQAFSRHPERYEWLRALGARPLDGSGRLEDASIEDVTTSTSVSQHVPGVGMSDGYLALEALRRVRAASEQERPAHRHG